MAKMISMKLLGVPQLQRRLKKYASSLEKHFENGLNKAGVWLLRESLKIVPVDTGLLRSTGKVTKNGRGFNTIIMVSYSTYYAIYVHEDLNARHAKGKSAKFLEIPYRQGFKTIQQIVRDECRKAKFK